MKSKLILLLYIISTHFIYSQSACYNSDFSTGTFSGWTGYYGTYDFPERQKGINDQFHKIITESTKDPRTCSQLSTIPPGESYSAKLGNEINGARSEKLVYTTSITAENSIFLYKFAIVVEDPGHEIDQQPGFSVKISRSNGDLIDTECGFYEVYAGQPDQNFKDCIYFNPLTNKNTLVKWTEWKTVGVNLTAYIGQTINIEFTTKDCALKEHFGYAYISTKCLNYTRNIKICSNENNFTLSAPAGFKNYVWSYQGQKVGEASQSTTLPVADYLNGAVFECTMTSYNNNNNCESKIQVSLDIPQNIAPNFTANSNCNKGNTTYNAIYFTNQTTSNYPAIIKWKWDFGDQTTSTEKNSEHVFVNSGKHTVTLTAYAENGCQFSFSKDIQIDNNPIAKPIIKIDQKFCNQSNTTIQSLDKNGQDIQWFDSETATKPLPPDTILVDGFIYYAAINSNGCLGIRDTYTAKLITVSSPTTKNTTQYFCSLDNSTVLSIDVKGDEISWYKSSNDVTPLDPLTKLSNNTTYYASQKDLQSNCESTERLAINVEISDTLNNLPSGYTKEVCLDNDLTIQSLNDHDIKMIFYETINSTEPLPEYSPLINNKVYYASVVDSRTNCESLKKSAILVSIVACSLTVYNSISLNNNNLNDHFVIKNIDFFPNNSVEIYNRFGQLVFKTSEYGSNGNFFYGEANTGELFQEEKKLPTGSYFYVINYKKDNSGKNNTQKGFLYITNNE